MENFTAKIVAKIAGSLTLMFSGIIMSFAQSPTFSQKYGTEEDYHRLFFLNIQYVQSWVRADTATFNRLLWAEDWIQQNSGDGLLYTKKQLLPVFGAERFETLNYFYPTNTNIQFVTNDVALVYSLTPYSHRTGVKELSQYNDVYVRRKGNWVCVSANISTLRKPGDSPVKFGKVPTPPPMVSFLKGSEEDKKVLTEINARHAEAFATSKSELLENILAEDFILLQTNGLLYKRNEVLEQVKASAKSNPQNKYSIENLFIRFVAHDVAMVHAAFVSTNKEDGMQSGIQYNDIYVKRNKAWVCVSGNNTSINNVK
jgi:hypothetical protein